ncbi:MAG TPA: UDP-N-acetylglucosamine 2-epimerase [Candidatus Sulfotelmatobacter sp.]
MTKRRKIAVVTTSRADYSHLYWPLRELSVRPNVDLKLIVLGSHLSPEFGLTVQEIEKDGIEIAASLESLLSSDTDVGMAKSIGIAIISLTDLLGSMRPDILLLIADRYELLAPASVALALRIPIAHIEGGEISEGAVDDAVRNAVTKMSHIHFTSTEKARERVISMGEESWRVCRAGAPSLDHLVRSKRWTRNELENHLGIDLSKPSIVVAYHPVTIAQNTTYEASALFEALSERSEQLFFCYPNADAGSRSLSTRTRKFIDETGKGRVFVNLDAVVYFSLLANVDLVLGNSSSGIMETASLQLPTVNIGLRQYGREQPRNVLDARADKQSILAKIEEARSHRFKSSLGGMTNPYGDGHAAERIADVLSSVPLNSDLLRKRSPEP